MAKTKFIMHECAYCRRETKMEFVGDQPSENTNPENIKTWYKCCKCKHSSLLLLSPAAKARKRQAIVFEKDRCTQYQKEKSFSIGEHIYHPEWDDMGKVIRKDKMSNGINAIVVSFEKLGERHLLENITNESNILQNI